MTTVNSIENLVEKAIEATEGTAAANAKDPYMKILRGMTILANKHDLTLGFGQHKGMTWREVPEDYRTWVREQIKTAVNLASFRQMLQK